MAKTYNITKPNSSTILEVKNDGVVVEKYLFNNGADVQLGTDCIIIDSYTKSSGTLKVPFDSIEDNLGATNAEELISEFEALGYFQDASAGGGGTAGGALETTAQLILAGITGINTNLTDNTNALLVEIRDSNIAQEALLTASNALLTNINATLTQLQLDGLITNQQLIDANTELDAISATLNAIQVADANFYLFATNSLTNITNVLNANFNELVDVNTSLDALIVGTNTLISQTDQVETLLGNIVTALTNNSTVNAASLELLRLLLVDIEADTTAITGQLTTVIAEHDQSQVLLTNINTALTNTEAQNVLRNTNLLTAINGASATQVLDKLLTTENVTFAINTINYIDIVVVGDDTVGTVTIGAETFDLSEDLKLDKYERFFDKFTNRTNPIAITVSCVTTTGFVLIETGQI